MATAKDFINSIDESSLTPDQRALINEIITDVWNTSAGQAVIRAFQAAQVIAQNGGLNSSLEITNTVSSDGSYELSPTGSNPFILNFDFPDMMGQTLFAGPGTVVNNSGNLIAYSSDFFVEDPVDTIVHEFSHLSGLTDYLPTDTNPNETPTSLQLLIKLSEQLNNINLLSLGSDSPNVDMTNLIKSEINDPSLTISPSRGEYAADYDLTQSGLLAYLISSSNSQDASITNGPSSGSLLITPTGSSSQIVLDQSTFDNIQDKNSQIVVTLTSNENNGIGQKAGTLDYDLTTGNITYTSAAGQTLTLAAPTSGTQTVEIEGGTTADSIVDTTTYTNNAQNAGTLVSAVTTYDASGTFQKVTENFANGFSGTFYANDYSQLNFNPTTGLISFQVMNPDPYSLGTVSIDVTTGASTLTLDDGTVMDFTASNGFMLADNLAGNAMPENILLNYLGQLGDPMTADQLDQANFNSENSDPNGTYVIQGSVQQTGNDSANVFYNVDDISGESAPGAIAIGQSTATVTEYEVVNGESVPVQVQVPATNYFETNGGDLATDTITNMQVLDAEDSIALTADQLAEFQTINDYHTGRVQAPTFSAASGGVFDLNDPKIHTAAAFSNIVATDFSGTTLIGTDNVNQTLTASEFGNDTLQAGNGTDDTLIAGDGVDTLIGGSGGATFIADDGLVAGSVVQGNGGTDVLQATGDISGATITGVQTLQMLQGSDITVSAAEFSEFSSITGGGEGTIGAATGGTYDIGNKTNLEYNMRADSNDGTTLIGNNVSNEILTASSAGNDTLQAGNGVNDTIVAGGGIDTITTGTGVADTVVANGGLAAGSSVTMNGLVSTLQAAGDISQATISGVQKLEATAGISLTASQLAGFSVVEGGGTLSATTSGVYDLSRQGGAGFSEIQALSSSGTTLIGNNTAGQELVASASGNDTLQTGNGRDDTVIAGGAIDTITTGAGTGDTVIANNGLAAGSSVTMAGTGGTLEVNGNISGVTLNGVDTLSSTTGVTLDSTELSGIASIAADTTMYAATGGTYTINGAGTGDTLEATANAGTTLVGDNGSFETLVASASGNDTLQAGNGSGDTLVAGGGNDTLIGGTGGDTFIAGTGDATFQSKGGSNTFVFNNLGSAATYLINNFHTDNGQSVLQFGSGIASSQVAVSRSGNDLALNLGADLITVQNYFVSGQYQLADIQFADGTVWTPDQIASMVVPKAQATLTTSSPIDFGNVRVGADASEALSIANSGTAAAEGLDASIGSVTGAANGSGSFTLLAPGDTDAADIVVGLDTSSAGGQSGTVTLDLASDGTGVDENGVTALPSQTVQVTGNVYREASASVAPPSNLIVHVGDAGVETLAVTNTAAEDGFSENLIASVDGTTGDVTASGSTGNIAAQATSNGITVDFSTATAGTVSGNVVLDLASDGTGVDGLGSVSLGQQAVAVNATVNNYANAVLEDVSGGSAFTKEGNAYAVTLNEGANAAPVTFGLGVLNDVTGPSDLLSGSFTVTGSDVFSVAGFDDFSGLVAGQADTAPAVTFDGTAPGVYTETITLQSTGSNASGYSAALDNEMLTITVNVGETENLTSDPGTVIGTPGDDRFVAPADPFVAGTVIDGAGGDNEITGTTVDVSQVTISNIQTVQADTLTLTADQLADLTALEAGSSGSIAVDAATGGVYDLSTKNITGALASMTAESNEGTTLIGNDADGEQLLGSISGNDTLIVGNGAGDLVVAGPTTAYGTPGTGNDTLITGNGDGDAVYTGSGIETVTTGAGYEDLVVASYGLAAGSSVTMQGAVGILAAAGDISHAVINGAEVLVDLGGVILTAAQFNSFSVVESYAQAAGPTQLLAATGGVYDISDQSGATFSLMVALSSDGTTLIGNDTNGQQLSASTSGNDTLEAGNGNNDILRAGSGIDTITAGTGSDDTVIANSGLAASSSVAMNGSGSVLQAVGDISGATLSGVQTLNADDGVMLTAAQLAEFSTIEGAGTLLATTGGTYDLAGQSAAAFTVIDAESSDGTTLIGNDTNNQELIASTSGNDTLTVGNGDNDIIFTGMGVDTITAGTGSGDTVVDQGIRLAVGSSVTMNGTGSVLDAEGDISGATISGVQTLKADFGIDLTAVQLAGFHTIEGAGGLAATTGGTYDLSGQSAAAFTAIDALSSDGTTLIGNGTNGQELNASSTGNDTLVAGDGNGDTLTGGSGTDTLVAGTGTDTLNGGTGYDSYQFGSVFGQDTISNGGSGTPKGEIDFTSGAVTDENLWFQQSGNNLVIDLLGTNDKITVNNWFGTNAGAQVTSIDTSDGLKLDSQIAQLVQAMASYATANPSFNPATATAMPTDTTLQSVIAAAWHH